MELIVGRDICECLLDRAREAYPREACGLLLGQGVHVLEIAATANVHPTPETHFEIDPQALIDAHRAAREGGAQLIGYYHSHPHGPPAPSVTDAAMASGDGRVWAIVGQGAVHWWCDTAQGFVALDCKSE